MPRLLMKRTPLKRKKPLRSGAGSLKRTRLKQQSRKRANEAAEYRKLRVAFLALPENRLCPVALSGVMNNCPDTDYQKPHNFTPDYEYDGSGRTVNCEHCGSRRSEVTRFKTRIRTTDVHHKKGRHGKLLNDRSHWLAVSREGHDFIHFTCPNEARRHGWLL